MDELTIPAEAITVIIALCAAVAACLKAPSETSGPAYRVIYTLINWVAFNLGRASNADDVRKKEGQ